MVTRADEYLVALDLGTSGLKVAVTTPRGEIAGSVQERYPLHVLGGGGVEQDPEDWWRAITRGTRREHLVRAALEAMAFSSLELLEAMAESRAIPLLRVDGGAAANDWLMQFQADMLGIPVERPDIVETFLERGPADAALQARITAFRQKQPHLRFIDGDARYLPLARDPRFDALMQRVGVRHPLPD